MRNISEKCKETKTTKESESSDKQIRYWKHCDEKLAYYKRTMERGFVWSHSARKNVAFQDAFISKIMFAV